METHIGSAGHMVIVNSVHKTYMLVGSKGFDHERQGVCITKMSNTFCEAVMDSL